MRRRTFIAASGAFAAAATLSARAVMAAETNALTQPWTGPHGGLPPFDKVKVADLLPALKSAMAAELKEIDAITFKRSAPTFENTIAAMERSGWELQRVGTIYGVWQNNLSTPDFQAVEKEVEPLLAAHGDKILQNAALFARVAAVYDKRETSGLTPEQKRLTWVIYDRFVRAGAKLSPEAKARVAAINQELAGLYTAFSQNLLADEAGYVLYLKEADLAGLPADFRASAAASAEEKGRKGEYAVLNTRSSMDPFLTYSDRRDLREKVWRTYYSRGDNGDAHDNNAGIKKILKLRAERARLLGYQTHAHWRIEDQMAKTPDAAMALMMRVWPSAIARVHEEVAEMQAIADAEKAGISIEPWDYRYYAEKVRKKRYDLDMNEVTPYLQLDKMREAIFWVAGRIYGFTFTPVSGVPVFNPDVKVWEVKDAKGASRGLWYLDPYARVGKNSGAWMNDYRPQYKMDKAEVTTLVSNNSNFVKPAPGQPVLISWDDAKTLFHEFGHALHGLNSDVVYPTLSGTSVARDYVEFPSQVNESWLPTREVLKTFAVHHKTGEPLPDVLIDKIIKAHTFRQGFDVTEYLSAAIIDMKLHLAGGADIDPDAFEREELAKLGMPKELPMRHRTPQFAHIFSSDAYSAGYYAYLWAEVLSRDCFEAFVEAGDPFDPATAKRLHDEVMSRGNTIDPADQYRAFRGRDPEVAAYLRDKGFPVA